MGGPSTVASLWASSFRYVNNAILKYVAMSHAKKMSCWSHILQRSPCADQAYCKIQLEYIHTLPVLLRIYVFLVLLEVNWSSLNASHCWLYLCVAWLQFPQQHKLGIKVLAIPYTRAYTKTPLGTDIDMFRLKPLQAYGTWVSWTHLTPGRKTGFGPSPSHSQGVQARSKSSWGAAT